MKKALELAVVLSAVDKMSGTFQKAAKASEGYLERLESSRGFQAMDDIGNRSLIAGTVITGAMGMAVNAAEESEIATARLDQVFRSMGETTGEAAKAAEEYASKLQTAIAVEDEEIMLVQAKLATFEQLSNETGRMSGMFDRATKAAFDLSSAGFGDASSNAVQLGKALQDPIKGIQALSRSGVTFTKEEKEKIKALTESGQQLKAQEMIMKAVEKQVGGVAEATASKSAKMKIAFGEVAETAGKALLPVMNRLASFLGDIIPKITAWIDRNPELVKGFAAAGVALLVFGGTIKLITGAVALFNAVAALNPFVLVAVAVVAAALLIYRNWGAISEWFRALWEKVKAVFNRFVSFTKNLLINFTPVGLIYKYWGPITEFFSGMWEKVKTLFNEWLVWVMNWPSKLIEVGGAIVDNIKNGISKKWESFKGWFKDKLQGLRDFLPFSPAKTGPLKDIHRLKFVETIAQNIKPGPMLTAMRGVTAAMAVAAPSMIQPASALAMPRGSGGGGVTIQYSPTINLPAGSTASQAQDFMAMMKQNQGELLRMVEAAMERKQRIKY